MLDEYRDFEFDLYLDDATITAFGQIDRGIWFPLKEGYMPAVDDQGFVKFAHTEPKHYSKFSGATKVGWRGPMIMWNNLKTMPDVFWKHN